MKAQLCRVLDSLDTLRRATVDTTGIENDMRDHIVAAEKFLTPQEVTDVLNIYSL